MKKKTIKLIALGISLLMTAGCFAGCGADKNEQASTEGSNVTLNGDKIYPIQSEDKLTYWMGSSTMWSHSFENFGDTPLGKAISENTGVNVEYIHPAQGQGEEQIQLLMASDELPDMVQHSWNNYPGGPDTAIKDEYILALNDVFEKYAPAVSAKLASNEVWDRQIKSDTGNYYAFPFMMEEGILQTAFGPMLRADWLRELNLEVPETIDEWEKVLQAFKDKGVEAPFIGNLSNTLQVFAPGFGVWPSYYQNDGKIVYGYAEPGFKELVTKLNDWYKKGLIYSDIATADGDSMRTKMLNDEAGSTIAWLGSGVGQWLTANADKVPDKFDVVGSKFPAMKKGENSEYSYMSSPVSMAQGTAINPKCPNVELAARFLDYGFTEEGHNLFNFGIEGESYEWVDRDGVKYPQYTDLIMKNPDGLAIGNAMGLYTRSCYNGIMVQDTRYMEQYYTTDQQKNAQKEWVKTNMGSHLLPQLYVEESKTERDAEITTNIKTYVEEMSLKFITGDEPIENFDKYLKQLESFGLSEAIAHRQDALDRYYAR